MNIGVLKEKDPLDKRVALTPPVVRQLVARGHGVWFESGAGDGAMFRDDEYVRAGAYIVYSPADVLRRSDLIVKLAVPTLEELDQAEKKTAIMAFFHMAVVEREVFQRIQDRSLTAIGNEVIATDDGRLPVLAALSEIAGQMTMSVASHLLRSSSGGRGILLGGSPGVPPARVVVAGAGVVGTAAAKTAILTGANVTVLDIDVEKLRRLVQHVPNITTALADEETVAAAVSTADVVVGAVLVAGTRAPHVVTAPMVESMRPGSVIIDVAIDQGGCVATSRPTSIAQPVFTYNGVLHYCVPNLTADVGRSASIAVSQALMPYVIRVADNGIREAVRNCRDLARGVYTYEGQCARPELSSKGHLPCKDLIELLEESPSAGGAARV